MSTTKLLGLFAVLVGVYFAVDYFGGSKKSKSLRSELVVLDTASVTSMEVKAQDKLVSLNKENGTWMVTLDNGKKVVADAGSVKRSLEALQGIKPGRMATRKKEKWEEYQVADTMGTRVRVFENSENVLDIILGKLGVTGQRSYHTFVRLAEDDEVYVVNNFMAFNVPSEASSYRNQSLAKMKKDSISAIEFNYPADSSLRLEKIEDKWMANGQPADSTKMAKYLRGLSYINSSKFNDEIESPGDPVYTSRFIMNDGSEISIDGFAGADGLVINSSENQASYFADSSIFKKVFIGPSGVN